MAEFESSLLKPRIARLARRAALAAFAAFVRAASELHEPVPLPPVCRDPDDDIVLATAVAADAQAIVTGDDDLLVLDPFQGVRILPPDAFLEAVGAGE